MGRKTADVNALDNPFKLTTIRYKKGDGMDTDTILRLRTDALAFLKQAQTAARNTTETDLDYFCAALQDLIESELTVSDESALNLFAELYDYYARV